MVPALPTQADLLAMLPSIAMLVAFLAVAGCCAYISHRVGQAISPSSRMLQQRFAELEAAIARSEKDFRQSLERHREANAKEAKRLLDDGARASEAQAQSVRRSLEDFGERLNAARLDMSRDSGSVREEVQSALAGLQAGAREDARESARLQSETLGKISAQIATLGSESGQRQECAMAAVAAIGPELKAIYASSAGELRERVAQLAQAIAAQGPQIDNVEQTIKSALRESSGNLAALSAAIEGKQVALNAAITGKQEALDASIERKQDALNASVEGKQDALNAAIEAKQDALKGAIEAQFVKFRDEASSQLVQLLAADERLEASWGRLKGDFDAITRSLVQISRAVDVLKNQLTVKLDDGGTSFGVDGLLQRVLQPTEYEQDVEIEPGTNRRVPFAVKLSDNPMTRVWLPIGTLPVVQGYNELLAATVYSDVDGIKSSSETFERAILAAAEDFSSKFVCPPRTLNLAVLVAPSDDLFAEIARRDSLLDNVQRNFHVAIAGPATLPTLLTGLRMAFRGTSRPSTADRPNGSGSQMLAEDGVKATPSE